MMVAPQHYGWIPDLPDQRDEGYVVPIEIVRALPQAVDLRAHCPPVYNQGSLGSCTANALAAAIAFEQRKLAEPLVFTPSRLFIYYNERALQNTITADTGAPLREGIKATNRMGVCPEDDLENAANWPYDPMEFAVRPSNPCYDAARHVRALRYQRLRHALEDLKGCLAEGYPFVFGFTVYTSFEGDQVKQTGAMPLPEPGETVIGGHAVMAVGYDDTRQVLIVRNSWGPGWGDKGYFYMPYEYLIARGLARDFWTIHLISDTSSDSHAKTSKAPGDPEQPATRDAMHTAPPSPSAVPQSPPSG